MALSFHGLIFITLCERQAPAGSSTTNVYLKYKSHTLRRLIFFTGYANAGKHFH